VSEALSGPVALRPRESAGPVARPGQPSIARPECHGANTGTFLSVTPDPFEASRPAISKYRMGTAASGAFAVPVARLLLASVVPGSRPRRLEVGLPGYPSESGESFLPGTFGLPYHWQTLARPSQSAAIIISERSTTAKGFASPKRAVDRTPWRVFSAFPTQRSPQSAHGPACPSETLCQFSGQTVAIRQADRDHHGCGGLTPVRPRAHAAARSSKSKSSCATTGSLLAAAMQLSSVPAACFQISSRVGFV
jgi:hypothetical protein